MLTWALHLGSALDVLKTLPDESVHCVVTSPPYYGLRDYGVDGQIGLEQTPDEYVAKLVEVFREARRVLRADGTMWLNLGDSYAAQRGGTHMPAETLAGGRCGRTADGSRVNRDRYDGYNPTRNASAIGLKHKDLIGIPWAVAFALRADGWYLRQDIIWHKPNPMPESVQDRCTKAHEYIFLLSKSPRYYYDNEPIREPVKATSGKIIAPLRGAHVLKEGSRRTAKREYSMIKGANRRSVWTVATRPYKGDHFATFPPALVEPCILAGCPQGGTVLDPFAGMATTGVVALEEGRNFVGIELNPNYHAAARQRLAGVAPLLAVEVPA